MRNLLALLFVLWSMPLESQQGGVRGRVTDPSGAAVPGATVQLRGKGRDQRTRTDNTGQYSFDALVPGKYQLRITAKGFAGEQKQDLAIEGAKTFDVQLKIQGERQFINVDDEAAHLGAEPDSNGSAVVMGRRQIAALSDDPDELALQLQALAGPAPGPNGGQLFVDGFAGGRLPPKSSIREVRINSNPFSAEYDRPGFARIEVFTKPGSDAIHGQAFAQFNDALLNSRNPLLAQATRPPYRTRLFGVSASGPVRKDRASFSFDAETRRINENAFILATTLDEAGNVLPLNESLATPQSRATISPRFDYALNSKHTVVARFQDVRIGLDNQGVGDFNLASRAYNERQSEQIVQLTETAMLSPRTINETRFRFSRLVSRDTAQRAEPVINVVGAFTGGGATIGSSASNMHNWEVTNISTRTKGRHTFKWGGRLRSTLLNDVSRENFGGTFSFYTLEQYGQGQPAQFSLNAGTPEVRLRQTDAGVFVSDDWRAKPNVTISFGLRYEAQTNQGDARSWAPRIGVAWGIRSRGGQAPETVIRAGVGSFYDRIPINVTVNALRYNGTTLQSFEILNPGFFPAIPPAGALEKQPQQTRPVFSGLTAPRLYQGSAGIEQQLGAGSRFAVTWIGTRGVHLLNTRNVNTPVGGAYPYGDRSIRLLTESAGLSSLNQVTANINVNANGVMVFGNYALSYGKDNNEGLPADPYNLRAEWAPSTYGDVRLKLVVGATLRAPGRFSVSPFFVANSGLPYDITTGLDPQNTGFPAARPALLPSGGYDLSPAPGTPVIERNHGRGPVAINLALRLSRTWTFGREVPAASLPGATHGGGNGPPPGMFAVTTSRRYSITLTASTMNALNRANYAPPSGNLSSPYFGQYRSLGGLMVMSHGGAPSTYNRKIDLQLRFTF